MLTVVVAIVVSTVMGCGGRPRVATVVMDEEAGWQPSPVLVVENFQGDVRIRTDASLTGLEVRSRVFTVRGVKRAERRAMREATSVNVEWAETSDGRPLLRVVSRTDAEEADGVGTHIWLWMPPVDSINVTTRGGEIELRGVDSSINAVASDSRAGNGSIWVRSDRALTEPVSLRTASGSITLQLTPDSAGAFELRSGDLPGEFTVSADASIAYTAHTDGSANQVNLNGGSSEMRLVSTGGGRVAVRVMADPESHLAARWPWEVQPPEP